MVGVAPDDRSRRRLPVWMLGVAAADETRNSDDVVERAVTKGPEKGVPLQEMDTSHFPVKCETKRKRKSSNRDANCEGMITETVSGKKKYNGHGRKVEESAASKRRKAKGSDFDDNDVELTIEDLMAIAEEYVKVEKNTEQQASNRECGSERQVLMTASSSRNSSEEIAIIDRTTVDPAQDMLDLFLGPLLKKPVVEEKKSFVKDIAFAYEFERQTQNNVVGEEIEPLMKKKSSLKDKVAMFLD
ncbi:uncharacterized protein LOC133878220 isoform X2 [Alnus glutinosa]|uniref:uncharacterized protein LOC133878220 isoform X2 n=1 Tax=Alnus glutinosa TaxID=3517 RepID=UPI002D78214D|nr:uncharacterized protein LOC133878220 isoform X2 [Alnus glutinosa]